MRSMVAGNRMIRRNADLLSPFRPTLPNVSCLSSRSGRISSWVTYRTMQQLGVVLVICEMLVEGEQGSEERQGQNGES